MPLVIADRVKETTTSTGTGTITLAGAVPGFQSFAAVGDGNTTFYTIAAQSGVDWEVGIGTYTASGTTLARNQVLASSNGGTHTNFSAGTKDVFVTYPAGRAALGTAAQSILTNQTTISQAVSLDSGFNGQSVGPVTISTSAAVTVPTGQVWLVFG